MCVQVSDWRRGAGHMRPTVLPTTTTTSSSSSACQTSLRECGTSVPSATCYELLSNNDSDSVLVQTELLQRKTRSFSQPTTNWCDQTNYLPSLSLPPPSPPLSLCQSVSCPATNYCESVLVKTHLLASSVIVEGVRDERTLGNEPRTCRLVKVCRRVIAPDKEDWPAVSAPGGPGGRRGWRGVGGLDDFQK